ncbi:MAG: protoporphyrinogen oxidase [Mycobacterium sp.]
MTAHYCVVGGGISGLTAAYRLRRAVGSGASITLFDPADRLGGTLRTERVGGQQVDVGAEAFIVRRPEIPSMLVELGLADRQIGTTGVRPLIYSGRSLHPMPDRTVNGIPSTPVSVAGLVDAATQAWMAAESDRPLRWQRGEDPAVAELVADRFGSQVVSRSVDPMLGGVYAGSAATIGLRSAVPTVADQLDRGAPSLTAAVGNALPPVSGLPVFGAIAGGYQVLLDALIRAGAPHWVQVGIVDIARDGPSWALRDDEGNHWAADAVVIAAPVAVTAKLLAGVAPNSAAAARRVPTASSAVVALAVPGGTPLPEQSGVLVASGEPLHAKAITLLSRKWGSRGNVELLRLSFGKFGDAAHNDIARRASDDDLTALALGDLRTVFGVNVEPQDVLVQRWIDAMPQYGPGHGVLVAQMRAGLPPGLALAGNYLDGIGVPACVGAATRAAKSVAR